MHRYPVIDKNISQQCGYGHEKLQHHTTRLGTHQCVGIFIFKTIQYDEIISE